MQGTRILITGAGSGIGRATAERAIAAGANVLLVDRVPIDPADFSVVPGQRVLTYVLDLADVAGLTGLAQLAEREFGGLDSLIHVAGVMVRRNSIDDVTEEDFDLQYSVNLKATFFLVVRLRGVIADGGSIVLFTSQGWWTGGLGGSLPYAATKAGIVAMTRGLSRELAPRGIRINAVAPGFVDTDMMRVGLSEDRLNELVDEVPLGRLATPEEVADTALFLVGPGAAYMTGATLNVTGGHLIY